MALSEEIASLKAGIHKLAVTVEILALRKFVEGEIDISKLTWFTPQYVPGDSIKLSADCIPTSTVCLDKNEVVRSPILAVSDSSLGAPHMFDKIPDPKLCLSQVQKVGVDDVDNMFHKTPIPDFIIEMAPVAKITPSDFVVGDCELEPDDLSNNTNSAADCILDMNVISFDCVEDAQLSSAHKVLEDKSPPHSSDDAFESDYKHDQSSVLDRRMFAKLGGLDSPCFHDLVIIGASRERFSALGSMLRRCQTTSGMLRDDDELYVENLCSVYPHFEVSIDTFRVLSTLHSINYIEQPLSMSDIDWFMSLNLSMILGVKGYNTKFLEFDTNSRYTFDPGIGLLNPVLFHDFTLEDKGDFEAVGNDSVRLVVLRTLNPSNTIGNKICERERLATRCNILISIRSSFLIFDPSGSFRQSVLWDALMHNFWPFYFSSLIFQVGNMMILVLDKGTRWLQLMFKLQMNSSLFEEVWAMVSSSDIEVGKSKTSYTLIHEDTGASVKVENDRIRAHNVSICWLLLLYVQFHSWYQWYVHDASMTKESMSLVPWVFDLGRYLMIYVGAYTQILLPTAIIFTARAPRISPAPRHALVTLAISFPWPSLVPSSASGQMKTSTDGFEPSDFVFDPGGEDSGPKMDKPQASNQRLKAIRRENHQTYVFDPGGSLTMYDIDEPRNASIITCL